MKRNTKKVSVKSKRKPREPRLILSESIGNGAYKQCFTIKGVSDRVALVQTGNWHKQHGRSDLSRELRDLTKLKKLGLPVMGGEIQQVLLPPEDDGVSPDKKRKAWALIASKYDFWWYVGNPVPSEMTVGHMKSVLNILRSLDKKKLYVEDLQFLGRGDKNMVISDPLGVTKDNDRSHMGDIAWMRNKIKKTMTRKRA